MQAQAMKLVKNNMIRYVCEYREDKVVEYSFIVLK